MVQGLARAHGFYQQMAQLTAWRIITGEFSEILVIPWRSLSATRDEDDVLGLRGPATDSVLRRASALVTTECHDKRSLLF